MTPTGIYNPALPSSWQNLSGAAFLTWAISSLISIFTAVAFIAMIFYFLFGGIMWITSGGDTKRAEGASKQITNAVIGLGLVAIGWALINLIGKFLGINILGGFSIPRL